MTRRSFPLAALALALCFLIGHHTGAQQPAESPDLSGEWQCAGWNMGVDPAKEPSYRGTVTMERREKDTYLVQWKMGERVVNRGVGLYDPRTGVFAAGYVISNQPGVAVWKLSEDRKTMDCRGTFQGQIGDVAHESWTRP
jgi:hypothetical protein